MLTVVAAEVDSVAVGSLADRFFCQAKTPISARATMPIMVQLRADDVMSVLSVSMLNWYKKSTLESWRISTNPFARRTPTSRSDKKTRQPGFPYTMEMPTSSCMRSEHFQSVRVTVAAQPWNCTTIPLISIIVFPSKLFLQHSPVCL